MATGVLLILAGIAIFMRAGKLADRILGPKTSSSTTTAESDLAGAAADIVDGFFGSGGVPSYEESLPLPVPVPGISPEDREG